MSMKTIQPKDFTKSALERMLMDAWAQGRSKKGRMEDDIEDSDDDESENDKLVALSRERGDSKPPNVVEDDLPEGLVDKYRSKKPPKDRKKNGTTAQST
jgi:hypothetical protein